MRFSAQKTIERVRTLAENAKRVGLNVLAQDLEAEANLVEFRYQGPSQAVKFVENVMMDQPEEYELICR